MAQRIEVQTLSDLSGTDGAQTTQFSLGLQGYEVDLTAEETAGLEKALAPFIDVARRIHGTGSNALKGFRGSKGSRPASNAGEIRTWLQENGYTPSPRGRISSELHTAWVNKVPAQPTTLSAAPEPTLDSTQEQEPETKPEPVSKPRRVRRGSL